MSELTKKLHILKSGGGTEETVSLYSSASECAEPNLKLQVDGTTAYAKLGDVTDSNATSLRVYRNSDNTTYAVLKEATTIIAIATLTLKAGSIHYAKYGTRTINLVGYDGTTGSLSPISFNYNGTQYTISSLYSRNVVSKVARLYSLIVIFSSAPSFTKMVIYIDGEEFELSKDSSDETSFSGTTSDTTDGFTFTEQLTYTIKILSVS